MCQCRSLRCATHVLALTYVIRVTHIKWSGVDLRRCVFQYRPAGAGGSSHCGGGGGRKWQVLTALSHAGGDEHTWWGHHRQGGKSSSMCRVKTFVVNGKCLTRLECICCLCKTKMCNANDRRKMLKYRNFKTSLDVHT